MRATIAIGLLSALLLVGGTASAFEVVPAETDAAGAGGDASNLAPAEPLEGASLVLPELGALGDASKFDFGLELLYGQNAQAAESEVPEGDVGVRGSIRHTF